MQNPRLATALTAKSPAPLGTMPPKQRTRGRVDEVVRSLGNSVQLGQFVAGDKLPTEAQLMARFHISRTVVREALSKLQAAGLVQTRHGVGTFVMAPEQGGTFSIDKGDLTTVADVISVLELRISLETEAAGLAAQRRTDHQLEAMRQALEGFEAAMETSADAVPADFQFHLEVARATGNRHFADLMTYLGTMIIPRTRINTMPSAAQGRLDYLRKVNGEHESIFNAIRNQDPEAARAAMRTHLANSRDRLRNR